MRSSIVNRPLYRLDGKQLVISGRFLRCPYPSYPSFPLLAPYFPSARISQTLPVVPTSNASPVHIIALAMLLPSRSRVPLAFRFSVPFAATLGTVYFITPNLAANSVFIYSGIPRALVMVLIRNAHSSLGYPTNPRTVSSGTSGGCQPPQILQSPPSQLEIAYCQP